MKIVFATNNQHKLQEIRDILGSDYEVVSLKEIGCDVDIPDPYTLNTCSKDESIRICAKDTMKDDLERMEYVPGNMYNFHPGSHVGQGVEKGMSSPRLSRQSFMIGPI